MTTRLMHSNIINNLEFLSFPHLDATGLVVHAFTTRGGGVSRAPFDSLNLYPYQDDSQAVESNRKLVEEALTIYPMELIDLEHGDKILHLNQPQALKLEPADAIITSTPQLPLTFFFADCVAVYLLDPVHRIIALIHSGWRGTLKNIAGKTLKSLLDNYPSNPKDLLAGIAPAIGPCCFEIEAEIGQSFSTAFPFGQDLIIPAYNNKCHIDLKLLVQRQLIQEGMDPGNIITSSFCTSCERDKFFSYRRDRGKTGRMAAILSLRRQNHE